MHIRNFAPRPFWLSLLVVAFLLPSPQTVRAGTSPDDTNPAIFGDGIYKKFGLDLGFAGRTHRWAIYAYGSGTAIDVNQVSVVFGDIALAGNNSTLSVHDYAYVSGDRYEQPTSHESISNYGFIGGTRFSSAFLTGGVTSLRNVSLAAAALTATAGSPTNISLTNSSLTFNNNPFAGNYVMQLSNFVLNNSTLTLNGLAGSAFVINVSNNFSLSNQSRILLSGGLTPSDVLFNLTGSGGTTQISGASLLKGTLLAYNPSGPQRTVTVTGWPSLVRGEVLANKVVVTRGGWVKKPHKVSRDRDDDEHEREHERPED